MADENRLCVLLVEDSDDARRAMSILLNRAGYQVHAARDYDEAVQLIQRDKCDLVISDLTLNGQTGLDLIRELKSRNNVKSIAVSGHAEPEIKTAARIAGFDRYITKPVDFTELLGTITELTRPSDS